MGVASLILGIVTIILSLFFNYPVVVPVIGVLGIILGAVGAKKTGSGVAKGGLVCSIIGTVLSLIFWIACVACAGGLAALG